MNMEQIDFDKLEKSSPSKSASDKKNAPSDIPAILADLIMNLPWSLALILFIIYVLLNSDIFINGVLSKINNASKNMVPTNKGTFISGLFLSIAFIIFYMLINK
jgi:hypothetical protein